MSRGRPRNLDVDWSDPEYRRAYGREWRLRNATRLRQERQLQYQRQKAKRLAELEIRP